MDMELGVIIALAIGGTSRLSTWLNIPRKLRAWITMLLIVLLHAGSEWLLNPQMEWHDTLLNGLGAGLLAVGLYSTGKNTYQQWMQTRNGQQKPNGNSSSDNFPMV